MKPKYGTMQFGDFYMLIHYVEDIREEAKEELAQGKYQGDEVSPEVAFYAAALSAVDRRIGAMHSEEKAKALLEGFQFSEVTESLVARAAHLPIMGTTNLEKVSDLIDSLLRQVLMKTVYLMEGKELPGAE